MLKPTFKHEVRILRDTLLAHVPLKTLVQENPTTHRIFIEHAPIDIVMPYILIGHTRGGNEYLGFSGVQSSKTSYKVIIVSDNPQTAFDGGAYISEALSGRTPVINESFIHCYHYITEFHPIFDHYDVQNRTIFMAGGIYDLYLEYHEV